jgi:nitrite reductase/ring-hydroxylating ferredoxin subunit
MPGVTETALSPDPGLQLAGRYDRVVAVGIARVWENVLDWEHLPALHSGQFRSINLLDSGSWGWSARVVNQPGDEARAQTIAVWIDRAAGRYCSSTVEGPGTGTEIWTTLTPLGPDRTKVAVTFHVAETRPGRLGGIGARYVEIYTLLWDEDEAMMVERERALATRRAISRDAVAALNLGPVESVRATLPRLFEFGGERFRLLELYGRLIAHAATCPHWLGPLGAVPVVDGCIRCPWHDYAFDVLTGASTDGRGLALASPPRVLVEQGDVVIRR